MYAEKVGSWTLVSRWRQGQTLRRGEGFKGERKTKRKEGMY